MIWNIVTDSSCDLVTNTSMTENILLSTVPFVIRIGDMDYVDDLSLNTEDMLSRMEGFDGVSHTSSPSPQSWIEQFEKADAVIAVTISSKLSGSMNSALIAKEMVLEKNPNKKIAVLDSFSTGPEIALCVAKIQKMIKGNFTFEQIVTEAERYLERSHIVFALSSFDNLIRNGRISKVAGFIARKLGIWGIGIGNESGEIEIKGKTRGTSKVISILIKDMKENGFCGGDVAISHCQNPELAEKLKRKVHENWINSQILILPTRGLCSYYAERNGLILSYEVNAAQE